MRRTLTIRLSDRPVMLVLGLLLAGAGGALWYSAGEADAGRYLAYGAIGVAALMILWAVVGIAADSKRRAGLDRAVDDEMGRKWGPGFSKVVGTWEKPWYILCGETGVGKTAALRAGRLPMAIGPGGDPITDASQGRNGTFMFDWWFFEDAIVLDSAGDLITNPDRRWIAFLDRVRDARPARPINGMILAVSAEDLLGDEESVRLKADLLARQVEVARQQLKVRFSLYLLVTKSDLITGFGDMFPSGSDLKLSFQILGWSNPQDPREDDRPTSAAAVRAGIESVVADLRRRRGVMLARTTTARADADFRIDHLDEMYAFPSSVESCLDNIELFVSRLVDRSGPVAPPLLRGVYFTSALRTGEALDVELQKAFGVDQLPVARRKASDRAFFLRDLLLDKIVPEAGLVAPLRDIVTAGRRRNRVVFAAAFLAAGAVVAGSVVGLRQTVGKVKSDTDFWQSLIGDRGASRMALFDKDGRYRGNDLLPNGQTVRQAHEAANQRADQVTSSTLLPMSAAMEKDRKAVHAELFREYALVPALVPPPCPPEAGPAELAAITKVLLDTQMPGPVSSESLQKDALALVAQRPLGADRSAVESLIKSGVAQTDSGGGAATMVTLQTVDRRAISAGALRWIEAYLSRTTADRATAAERGLKTIRQAKQLQAVADGFVTAFNGNSSEDQDAAMARARAVPADVQLTPLSADDVKPDPSLSELRKSIESMPNSEAGSRILHWISAETVRAGDAARQWYEALPNVSDRPADATAALPAAVDEFNNRYLSDDHGAPAVVARIKRLRATAEAVASMRQANDSVEGKSLWGLHDTISTITARSMAAENELTGDNDDARLGRKLVDSARKGAVDKAWATATAEPWAVDVSVVPVPSDQVVPRYKFDPKAADRLVEALEALRRLRGELKANPPSTVQGGVAAETRIIGLLADVREKAAAAVDQWAAVDGALGPNLGDWADFTTKLPQVEVNRINGDLDTVFAPQKKLLDAIDVNRADWPAVAAKAGDLRGLIDGPVDLDRAAGIAAFLHRWPSSPSATRAMLLQDPGRTDRELAAIQTKPQTLRDRFWQTILANAVDDLVATQRVEVVAAMRRLHDLAADQYPLCDAGTKDWNGDVSALRTAVAAVRPPNVDLTDPVARRIRDLDVIDPKWGAYLAYTDRLIGFLAKPLDGSIRLEKEDNRGNWEYVAIQPLGGKPGRPAMYDRRMKPTPIDDIAYLKSGVEFKLLSSTDRPKVVTEIVPADSPAKPWALLRLALQSQPARLTAKSLEVTDKFYGVYVFTKLDAATSLNIPRAVPDVPK